MFDGLTTSHFFFLALLFWGIGAIGSLLLRKHDRSANRWAHFFAFLGSVAGLIIAMIVLLGGDGLFLTLNSSLPLLSFSFHVDQLSAFFIGIISLVSLIVTVYATGYITHYYRSYNIGSLGFFYNLFLAGMVLVVSAHHALFFLIVWEIMSLSSYFLVIFEHKKKSTIAAGSLYFIMTHVGTAFITLAFLLLYRATGSFDFGVIAERASSISPLVRDFVFVFGLIGFGTKAGIIPLHIWLPSAHPAAPSHVSALMSGVMIKTGIYMMIRLFMDILPSAPLWWGVVVIIVGAVASLLGVLYALTENDIKRLLAFSSIENIGIILLGLGSSLIFWSLGMNSLAMLGLVAALFHTLNHALFKALLFLGAGSVISATHTRNMEEYGGLIKLMPGTAFFFLIGSLAISAFPPFNGFSSEWMTFQSLFSGIITTALSVRIVFLLAAGSLAFTGGLAAMCFVKAFGATFLARPRSTHAAHATEIGFSLQLSMGMLAALTLIVGLFSSSISQILSRIVSDLSLFQHTTPAFVSQFGSVNVQDGFSTFSSSLLFLALAAILGLVFGIVTIGTRTRRVEIKRTWDCGTEPTSRAEITATGFARSIITIFRGVLKPTTQTEIEYKDSSIRYFQASSTVAFGIRNAYEHYLYQPIVRAITFLSEQIKKVQNGNINTYILYLFLILIALLLIVGF